MEVRMRSRRRDRDNKTHCAEALRRLAVSRPDDLCHFVAHIDLQTGVIGHEEKLPTEWSERDAIEGEVYALIEMGTHFLRKAIERASDYEDSLARYYRSRVENVADVVSKEARKNAPRKGLITRSRRRRAQRFRVVALPTPS